MDPRWRTICLVLIGACLLLAPVPSATGSKLLDDASLNPLKYEITWIEDAKKLNLLVSLIDLKLVLWSDVAIRFFPQPILISTILLEYFTCNITRIIYVFTYISNYSRIKIQILIISVLHRTIRKISSTNWTCSRDIKSILVIFPSIKTPPVRTKTKIWIKNSNLT